MSSPFKTELQHLLLFMPMKKNKHLRAKEQALFTHCAHQS